MSNTSNNKRIAKNTILLYFRMILVSLVSLYTTRITLEQLGVQNFGVYNVVGGVVGFLGMLNGSMASATQRFLAFELGVGDLKRFNKIFSLVVNIFITFSFFLLLVAIAFGPVLVNDLIVIPEEKRSSAMMVYYFSVVTFFVSFNSIPYLSAIIASEKMGIYASMSFIEVFLKLLLVFALYLSSFEKLLTYGFLTMVVTFFSTIFYCVYCVFNIKGCNYKFFWGKSLFYKLCSYIGWNLFGSITSILNTQGLTLLLNIFFGPLLNAAKAISDKINGLVVSFSNNYYMAVRPQIIKSYASGDYLYMFKLVNQSSKFSFYLLFVLTLPLIILMRNILLLWLGASQVTLNMVLFSQLMLIFSLVNVFENPITAIIQATGNIRNYEVIIGFITLSILPICFFLFTLGYPPYYSLIILIFVYLIAHFFRLLIAKQQIGLSILSYVKNVIAPVVIISVPSSVLSYYLCKFYNDNLLGVIYSFASCFIISFFFITTIGLDKVEKKAVYDIVKTKFKTSKI